MIKKNRKFYLSFCLALGIVINSLFSIIVLGTSVATDSCYTISEEQVKSIIMELNEKYSSTEQHIAPIDEVEKALRPYLNPNYNPIQKNRASGVTILGAQKIRDIFPDPIFATTMATFFGKSSVEATLTQANFDAYTGNVIINGTGAKNVNGVEYFRRANLLSISGGEFETLPDNIDNLASATLFQIINGKLKRLPDSIANLLRHLRAADMMHNELEELPSTIGTPAAPSLYNWDLKDNKLTSMDHFVNLNGIQAADFSDNLLEEIPESWVSSRPNTTFMYFARNNIKNMPESFGKRKIYQLEMQGNKIEKIPAEISKMQYINYGAGKFNDLNFADNLLEELPTGLANIANVRLFHFNGNKLQTLTPDVLNLIQYQSAKIKIYGQVATLNDKTLFDDTVTVLDMVPEIITQLRKISPSMLGTVTVTNTADGSLKQATFATFFATGYDPSNLFGDDGIYEVEIATPVGISAYDSHKFNYKVDWTKGALDPVIIFEPDNWTKDDVKIKIEATANIDLVSATIDGKPLTLDASKRKVSGTYTFTNNKSVTIQANRVSGRMPLSVKATVSWIDREKPEITILPDVSSQDIHALTATDLVNVVATDPDSPNAILNGDKSSGVNGSVQELLLYRVKNGITETTASVSIPWGQLATEMEHIAPGRYFYDISIADNVGNKGLASDAFAGKLIGIHGIGGPTETGVTINASRPTIETVSNGTMGSNGWYTSPVQVDIKSNNKSGLHLVDVELLDNTNSIYQKNPNSATNEGQITLQDGIHHLTGHATDEIDLIGSLTPAPTIIKIDTNSPMVTASASSDQMLKNIKLTGTDFIPSGLTNADVSGIDANAYTVEVISLNKQVKKTYTGSQASIQNSIQSDTTLLTGVYTVKAVGKDMAGNISAEDTASGAEFLHELAGDTIVNVKVTYSPVIGQYTNHDVIVSYEVISKLPLASVSFDGIVQANSDVSSYALDYLYYYSGSEVIADNQYRPIQVITKGVTQPADTYFDIYWIDKLPPTVGFPATNAISLLSNADFTITDPTVLSESGKSVSSGLDNAKTTYALKSIYGVKTEEYPTIEAAYAEASANYTTFSKYVNIIVTAYDKAGNTIVEESPDQTYSLHTIPPDENKEQGDIPSGLDKTMPPVKLSIIGGVAGMSSMPAGKQIVIQYMDTSPYNRIIVCKQADANFTDVSTNIFAETRIGSRIILKVQPSAPSGYYELYVISNSGSFYKAQISIA